MRHGKVLCGKSRNFDISLNEVKNRSMSTCTWPKDMVSSVQKKTSVQIPSTYIKCQAQQQKKPVSSAVGYILGDPGSLLASLSSQICRLQVQHDTPSSNNNNNNNNNVEGTEEMFNG